MASENIYAVGDVLNAYPISDGFKTIKVVYVNGYINSSVFDFRKLYMNNFNF